MLKQFVNMVPMIFEALTRAQSGMFKEIYEVSPLRACSVDVIDISSFALLLAPFPIQGFIDSVINEDPSFQFQPLDLRIKVRTQVRYETCDPCPPDDF